MPNKILYHALNVGVVDRDKLHRVDLTKMRLAAETQDNLLCDAVGKAFLRPGFKYLDTTYGSTETRLIEFDAGTDQVYGLELGDETMRVWDGEALVSRPEVTTVVTNGNMASSVGWTLSSGAGTVALITGDLLTLKAEGRGSRAYARRQVTLGLGDANVEHGLGITVTRGPVRFRVGYTAGADDLMKETVLRTGYHSLAIVPTGAFWIEFSTKTLYSVQVDEIAIEAEGAIVLPTIWGEDDLSLIRYDQSLDVMFLACEGKQQQRIESRGDNSWSVVNYEADDGPFVVGQSAQVKLKPTVTEGNGLLQSDAPFFNANHLGALFRIYHDGQKVTTILSAEDNYSPPIMVTGINEPDYNEREFSYTISGTWVGTLRWERSFDGEDIGYHSFRKEQASAVIDITANVGPVFNDDNEDNAIAWYRLGFQPGSYTSGSANISITYDGGGGFGIARVIGINSSTEAQIVVLKPFAGTEYSDSWREGAWSLSMGWPTAVAFDDGRLNWAGSGQFWGSVSDAFDSFDEEVVGDSGPLLRSIAVGGRNEARWLVSMSRLLIGTNRMVAEARASSLEEIKTPDNFGIKRSGGRIGAARISPVALSDDRALFVGESGDTLFEINYDSSKGRFLSSEFSKLTTDVFASGITGMAVQNRPDQRIWVTTNSGEAVCIVYQPEQEVVAFIPIKTREGDSIESIIVLPTSSGQDRVMAVIKRYNESGSAFLRHIELLATDEQAKADTDVAFPVRCLDCYTVSFVDNPSYNIVVPNILMDIPLWIWRNGSYIEDADGNPIEFVAEGSALVDFSAYASGTTESILIGVPYVGRYKSAKLEYGSGGSTSVLTKKTVSGIGILMADYVRSGIHYGTEFDNANHPLLDLPLNKDGIPVTTDIVEGPDDMEPVFKTGAPIGLDQRMCIEVTKPATILALVLEFESYG